MYSVYEPKSKEKKKSNKLNKKVSKYRDKDGHIKKEMQDCVSFVEKIQDNTMITKSCYSNLITNIPKFRRMNITEIRLEIYHKLKRSLNRNNYFMEKMYKSDGFVVYDKADVCFFILVLFESLKRKMIKSFLDIPDVFYILRQIKGIGIKYYLEVIWSKDIEDE